MSTLNDVSRVSGLSVATVSKYLNGIRVKAENEEKIRRAIESCKYSANFYAKSLKTGQSMTIGVLIPNMASAFYSSVVAKLEQLFAAKGYTLLVSGYNNDAVQEKNKFLSLLSRRVDSILIAPENIDASAVTTARDNGTPVLFFDTFMDMSEVGKVITDNYAAAKQVMTRLLENGFEKIAVLLPSALYSTTEDRRRGCLDAACERGRESAVHWVETSGDITVAYAEMRKRLVSDRPDAVFALSSTTFLGALMAVSDEGLKIPNDIAFIGYDNRQISKIYTPNISLVYQPPEDIAQAICEQLEKLMAGETEPTVTSVKSRITYTDSIKKCR